MLAEAVSDGRLTLEEHAERLEEASSARTLGELAGLTVDLAGPDDQPLRLDGARPVAAFFGSQRRDGRWVVPERLAVTAIFGEAVLDFRSALLQSSRVTVYATVICGRLRLLIPEGIRVEISGTSVASLRHGVVPARPPAAGRDVGDGRVLAGGRTAGGGRAAAADQQDMPVIEVRGLIMGGRVQAVTPPRGRFLGLFPRRGLPRGNR
jgi:hypothetical protein